MPARNGPDDQPAADHDAMAPPQRRWMMLCILLGVILANLDSAIANIALPTIGRELAASDAAVVWVVNSYQLAVAVFLLPVATLGEILGLKRVYAFGLALFTLASLGCALSQNLTALIGARLAQGIGGACVAALGPALVREVYPRRMLSQGFAFVALAVAISGAIGPTIASVILSIARWPWLFLVNLPVCLVTLPIFLGVAPRGRRQKRVFDFQGALLSAVALGMVVMGIDTLGPSTTRLAVYEIIAGLAGFALLVWQQRGQKSPLLPLDLLKMPLFTLSIATSICSYSAQILAYVSLPFMFQAVMHRSQVATGLLVTPWPLMVAVSAPVAGRLATRHPAAVLGSIGLRHLQRG